MKVNQLEMEQSKRKNSALRKVGKMFRGEKKAALVKGEKPKEGESPAA